MTYQPGTLRAAKSAESPPKRPILSADSVREEFGMGADKSQDDAIKEAVQAAQEYVTEYLGYSPVPDERLDSYPNFADRLELGDSADPEAPLIIRYLDSAGALQDFAVLEPPIVERIPGQRAYYDRSAYLPGVSLTPDGVAAAQAIASLDASAANPVTIAYTEAPRVNGATAIRMVVRKLAFAIFGQNPTQPMETAYAAADRLLAPFRKIIG